MVLNFNIIKTTKNMVTIYAHKTHPEAIIPTVAYNSTSACFDITCIETTTIPAKGKAIVPNGLNLTISDKEKYWMQIQLRSSKGFKYDLVPHYGTVDAGYTGNLGIKIYNLGDIDITIEKGEKYAQIAVIEKPDYEIIELNDQEFEELKSSQLRGDSGFGSSGK
jgi:dUTP pyrophosphatase